MTAYFSVMLFISLSYVTTIQIAKLQGHRATDNRLKNPSIDNGQSTNQAENNRKKFDPMPQ